MTKKQYTMANICIRTGEVGKKFNRLTLIENIGKIGKHYSGLYRCDCGVEKVNRLSRVESGHAKSCGCLAKETAALVCKEHKPSTTHGITKEKQSIEFKLYNVHNSIKTRCYNPNSREYKWYGARGISMCKEWRYDAIPFVKWCLENGYKEGLQVDRRNNDQGYSPENCRLVTRKVNMNNRRGNHIIEYKGESFTISQLADKTGLSHQSIYSRFYRGWSLDRIISQPQRAPYKNYK